MYQVNLENEFHILLCFPHQLHSNSRFTKKVMLKISVMVEMKCFLVVAKNSLNEGESINKRDVSIVIAARCFHSV